MCNSIVDFHFDAAQRVQLLLLHYIRNWYFGITDVIRISKQDLQQFLNSVSCISIKIFFNQFWAGVRVRDQHSPVPVFTFMEIKSWVYHIHGEVHC